MSDTKNKPLTKVSGLKVRIYEGGVHTEYSDGETLTDMIKEELIAERIAIEPFSEMIRGPGDDICTKIEHH